MQTKTRIHALDQSDQSILMDMFDQIPDALILVIFNKIGDVRSLGRCACVSKRFNIHIHLVHDVYMKIDQVVTVDGEEAMNLPSPKPRNFLSHFFKLFFNILKPFNHICNYNSGNKTLLPQVSHHSPAQVLKNFTNIQNVTIELPSSDVGTENGVVLKWRAVFGSTLQNCVILGGIRTEQKLPSPVVVSDLVEEGSNSNSNVNINGVLPESFYTNGGLKLRVVWTINSLIAASTRHYFMHPVIRNHPSLKSLILTDADGQGTLSMGVEQLKEFREKPLTTSLSTSRTQVPGMLEDAFDRARQLYLSYYRSIPKSLERSTAHKLMAAMLNGDERFMEPTPESLQKLTLKSVKDAVMNQFTGNNMEVSIAGDFTEAEIESCILDYLGTVTAAGSISDPQIIDPIVFRPFPSDIHFQQVFLKDTDERACAYIAGPAPNRWGFDAAGRDLFHMIRNYSPSQEEQNNQQRNIRGHPLFFGIALGLLAEIINSRLFTTVRDSLGLTYDVSFELSLFDRLRLGWYVVSVTSTPAKVYKAVDACKSVLRGLHSNKLVQRELDRAKRTLLMRHEAETKSNAYWLGLVAHLQSSAVPRKDVSCIKDLTSLYEAATIEDIYVAYEHLKVDDESLFSCVGVAGAEAGEDTRASEVDEELNIDSQGVIPTGRGRSTMTRPTT